MATYTLTGDAPQGGEPQGDNQTEKKVYPIIPEDTILNVKVTRVEEEIKPFKDDDGSDIVRVVFTFQVQDGEYEKQRVWGETSTFFTPLSKLRQWASELYGTTLHDGFVLDTDDLVGKVARIQVGVRTQKNGKQRNFAKDVFRPRDAMVSAITESPAPKPDTYEDPF